MKKLLFVTVLLMSALLINAQRTPVKVADLQKSITDNVTKDYPGFIIKDATKTVEKNVSFYEVVVSKGTTQETLLYDKDGKFMKKMGLKAGTIASKSAAKPGSKPVTKSVAKQVSKPIAKNSAKSTEKN